jgi:hypothetical protein
MIRGSLFLAHGSEELQDDRELDLALADAPLAVSARNAAPTRLLECQDRCVGSSGRMPAALCGNETMAAMSAARQE